VYALQNTKVHVAKSSLSGGSILCQECAKSHLRASEVSKIFRGYTPGPPLKRGEDMRRERRGGERREREGRRMQGEGGKGGKEGGEERREWCPLASS
jgi:hypothetical protein